MVAHGASGKRWVLPVLAAVLAPVFAYLFVQWRAAARRGGQGEADPFRIAGNFYYVGATDVASFLITGPEGHILIDGGFPATPPLIIGSIAKLGFDIRDVKILLNSEPHYDHAGGLAELQKASGAEIWASDASADAIEAGGDEGENTTFTPMRVAVLLGLQRYDPARVRHRIRDGETIRLGSIAVTGYITGGHTRGCTTWTTQVREGDRTLNVVSACSLEAWPGVSLVEPERYPGIRANFEKTFRVLRNLPMDIWVTSHARLFGRYRKYQEQAKSKSPADPFIDAQGYLEYIAAGEARFQKLLAEQQGRE